MIRILVADDHAMFRSGLKALLEAEPDLMIVGEAATGPAALRELEALDLDLMVLDLSMPGGMSGPRVAEEALKLRPGLAIVVLTMHEEDYYLRETFEIGARAFVLKRSEPTHLLAAIRAVHRGEQYVDPALVGAVMDRFVGRLTPSADSRLDMLTSREQEVCRLVALGHTNNEVGAKLFISARTVETHRRNVMNRLGLRNRAELVRFAIENGLVKLK